QVPGPRRRHGQRGSIQAPTSKAAMHSVPPVDLASLPRTARNGLAEITEVHAGLPTCDPAGASTLVPRSPLTPQALALAAPPHEGGTPKAAVPRRLGRYRLVRELGRGAMGVVYLARHQQLRRQVALKVILTGGRVSREQLARFRTE